MEPDWEYSRQVFRVTLTHSSTVDIRVEEIQLATNGDEPRELLSQPRDRNFVDYVRLGCGPTETIEYHPAPQHRRDMSQRVYEASIVFPADLSRLAIDVKYKTKIDQLKERNTNHYRDLLHSAENADAKFILKDGQIMGHTVILAGVKYFKELFASAVPEAQTKEIHIDDHANDDFRMAMEYIYTGTIRAPCDSQRLAALFTIAEKCKIEELSAFCLLLLRRQLQSTDRVVEVLDEFFTLSEAIGVPAIRTVCEEELDFMVQGGDAVDPIIFAHNRRLHDMKSRYLKKWKIRKTALGRSIDQLRAHPEIMLELFKVLDDKIR